MPATLPNPKRCRDDSHHQRFTFDNLFDLNPFTDSKTISTGFAARKDLAPYFNEIEVCVNDSFRPFGDISGALDAGVLYIDSLRK
jgi:hypothetical protein